MEAIKSAEEFYRYYFDLPIYEVPELASGDLQTLKLMDAYHSYLQDAQGSVATQADSSTTADNQ